MCEPTLMASVAFSALTTGLSYSAERQSAKQTARYQQEAYNQNAESAGKAFQYNTAQEVTRLMQEEDSTSQASHQIELERRRQVGAALASSNAAGLSIEELEMDFVRQEANQKAVLQRQMEWKRQQSGANMQGYRPQR